MPRILVTGYLRARPEDAALIGRLLPDHIRLSRAEPGCLRFEVVPSAKLPAVSNTARSRCAGGRWGRLHTRTRFAAQSSANRQGRGDGRHLRCVQVERRQRVLGVDRIAATPAGRRVDRHARLLERRQVTFDGARADLEPRRQPGRRPVSGCRLQVGVTGDALPLQAVDRRPHRRLRRPPRPRHRHEPDRHESPADRDEPGRTAVPDIGERRGLPGPPVG